MLPLFLVCLFSQSCVSQKVEHNYQSTVHTFNEAWNTGNYDLLDEVVHPGYTKLEGDQVINGVESLKSYVKAYRESYLDVKITYIDEVYGNKKAAINFTIEGTPKESGKKFIAEGMVIFRFRDNKIIEDHSVFDQLSALNQQGYALVNQQKTRILFDTDANNELDDQHALAYLLFNGDDFDVEGITVNRTKSGGDIDQHYKEAERVVQLCGLDGMVDIFKGASGNFEDIKADINKSSFDGDDAVNFIISRAKAASDRKLVLLPVGKLTNIALALYKDPSIADQVRIVWLGSNYPESGEYNQENDRAALQYILDTQVDFEVVLVRYDQPSGTDAVKAYFADIKEIMPNKGPKISSPVVGRHGNEFSNFGDYSISLFKNIEEFDDGFDEGYDQARALFDMAAVAIVKNPFWATPASIPSPELVDGVWKDRPENLRKITIWENFNKVEIMKDFYHSMENYVLVNAEK
jgi:purine nucleosidase